MWWSFAKAVLSKRHRLSPLSLIAVIGTAIYTIWPIDAVPDLVLGPLGYIDDLGLWGVTLAILNWERGRYEKVLREGSVPGAVVNNAVLNDAPPKKSAPPRPAERP